MLDDYILEYWCGQLSKKEIKEKHIDEDMLQVWNDALTTKFGTYDGSQDLDVVYQYIFDGGN